METTGQTWNFLLQVLRLRVSEASWDWFQAALQNQGKLHAWYTFAERHLGVEPLNLDLGEILEVRKSCGQFVPTAWRTVDLGRVILLMGAPPDVTATCYEMGDASEKQSWLRGLTMLPQCEQYLPVAIKACGADIVPVFEAIACENPYPYVYFPEPSFNQMVIKSLFHGVSLERIAGLEYRLNSELSKMADEFASERRAAGRDVPADIHLAK